MRPTCATKALWDGPHAGIEGARRCFLADGEAHDIAHAGAVLRRELPRELSALYHERGRAAVDEALQYLYDEVACKWDITAGGEEIFCALLKE